MYRPLTHRRMLSALLTVGAATALAGPALASGPHGHDGGGSASSSAATTP
jgi:hypothetical protein